MKNLIATAALTVATAAASTAAFADAHAQPTDLTCAEFGAMELVDQEAALQAIVTEVSGADVDEVMLSEIAILCNGNDELTVADVLADGTDS